MPINRSIRDLPKNSPDGGWPPDEDPWLATAIVDWWGRNYKDKGAQRAIAERQWRASWSLYRCDRQLAYALTDTAESDPPTIADKWRFWLGETIHEYFQGAVYEIFGSEWEIHVELKVDLAAIEIDGSLHGDVVLRHRDSGRKLAVEIKSINGMGFKDSACTFRGKPPTGPRVSHVLQGGMLAEAEHCDQLVIIYLAMENVSPDLAAWTGTSDAGRFCAQWTLYPDEWVNLVNLERIRLQKVNAAITLAKGRQIRRLMHDLELPIGATVDDPMPTKGHARWVVRNSEGNVTQTGTTWRCAYCSWRHRCILDGA